MIGAIAALFGFKEVTAKWILGGLAALMISLTVGAGYLYVRGLQNDLVIAKSDLARETVLRQTAQASAQAMREHMAQQASAMKRLGDSLAQARETWAAKQDEIDNLDWTDASKAAADFTRLSHELNRMLERSSANRP